MSVHGTVTGIYTAEIAGAEMVSHDSVSVEAGRGIVGDRYATGQGHYSVRPHPDRQITIIEAEVLDAIREETGIILDPSETRRNLVTNGVRLNPLVGHRFYVGECLLYAGRLNTPCAYLERLIDLPVMIPLTDRSGINCQVLTDGRLNRGDSVLLHG